jgi:hypothetical protein
MLITPKQQIVTRFLVGISRFACRPILNPILPLFQTILSSKTASIPSLLTGVAASDQSVIQGCPHSLTTRIMFLFATRRPRTPADGWEHTEEYHRASSLITPVRSQWENSGNRDLFSSISSRTDVRLLQQSGQWGKNDRNTRKKLR